MKLVNYLLIVMFSIICDSYASNKKYLPLKKTDEQNLRNHTTSDLLKSYMEFSSFKHKILSENLANINTPSYEAKDVTKPREYNDLMGKSKINRRIRLAKTSTNHMLGARKDNGKFLAHKLEDPYEVKPNGNSVSLAQQMTKISQNQQDYNGALKSYNATDGLISAVLGK